MWRSEACSADRRYRHALRRHYCRAFISPIVKGLVSSPLQHYEFRTFNSFNSALLSTTTKVPKYANNRNVTPLLLNLVQNGPRTRALIKARIRTMGCHLRSNCRRPSRHRMRPGITSSRHSQVKTTCSARSSFQIPLNGPRLPPHHSTRGNPPWSLRRLWCRARGFNSHPCCNVCRLQGCQEAL